MKRQTDEGIEVEVFGKLARVTTPAGEDYITETEYLLTEYEPVTCACDNCPLKEGCVQYEFYYND